MALKYMNGTNQPAIFTHMTFTTIFVTLAIVISNCLILLVISWTKAFKNVNKWFLLSSTISDLLLGLFVTPFSIFNSLYNSWVFANDIFCCIEAYVAAALLIAGLYSLAWLQVDHYVAIRKPDRYKYVMSPTRSACWIGFVWLVSISFCMPPLFSLRRARYYREAFICIIEAKQQRAYFMTAGLLVAGPAISALFYTSFYMFTKAYKKQLKFYNQVFVDRASRPLNYRINLINSTIFIVCWLPWCLLRVHHAVVSRDKRASPEFHFYFLWLGISTAFIKFIVYVCKSKEFRDGLRESFNVHADNCDCPRCVPHHNIACADACNESTKFVQV
ncbi:hypothetical protein SNE40_003279 [Patella caerulea]|uniref:G-protein coupled receptors family 1 profile domain-containing protein n=1 Tax=Patella caerulea TaxID=87958 RepID=A0AAN8Q8F4_PATCE